MGAERHPGYASTARCPVCKWTTDGDESTVDRAGCHARETDRAHDDGTDRTGRGWEVSRLHGTNARYHLDGCRCRPCSKAAVEYDRRRNRLIAYGRWQPYIDAEPARRHVRGLMAQGMGWKRIARTSGVASGTLTKLLYGAPARGMAPSKRIRPETAAKLLAVEADLAPAALVNAGPSWQIIRGLIANGYTRAWISSRIGQDGRALQLGRDRIEHRHALTIRGLGERYATVPGPSVRSRRYAERHGWTVDLLWDALDGLLWDALDGELDPTVPDIDEIAVERAIHGEKVRLTEPERAAAFTRLRRYGSVNKQTLDRLGMNGRRYRAFQQQPPGAA